MKQLLLGLSLALLVGCSSAGLSSIPHDPKPACTMFTTTVTESQLYSDYKVLPFTVTAPQNSMFESLTVANDLYGSAVRVVPDGQASVVIDARSNQSWNIAPVNSFTVQQIVDQPVQGSGVKIEAQVCTN